MVLSEDVLRWSVHINYISECCNKLHQRMSCPTPADATSLQVLEVHCSLDLISTVAPQSLECLSDPFFGDIRCIPSVTCLLMLCVGGVGWLGV